MVKRDQTIPPRQGIGAECSEPGKKKALVVFVAEAIAVAICTLIALAEWLY